MKNSSQGWENGLVVKGTCYSSKGPEFGFQKPHDGSKGIQHPLLVSADTHMAYTHGTYM